MQSKVCKHCTNNMSELYDGILNSTQIKVKKVKRERTDGSVFQLNSTQSSLPTIWMRFAGNFCNFNLNRTYKSIALMQGKTLTSLIINCNMQLTAILLCVEILNGTYQTHKGSKPSAPLIPWDINSNSSLTFIMQNLISSSHKKQMKLQQQWFL